MTYDFRKTAQLFDRLRIELHVQRVVCPCLTDPSSQAIFNLILGSSEPTATSQRWVAAQLGLTRKQVRHRLYVLARFSLVRVEYQWANHNQDLRSESIIEANPAVRHLLGPGRLSVQRRAFITGVVKRAVQRAQKYDDDVQGFRVDCRFGVREPDNGPMCGAEALAGLMDELDDKKALEARMRAEWREITDIFVAGASSLWVWAQIQFGYGSAVPNWAMGQSVISAGARQERGQLAKTFQSYGGRVAGLAWYVFVGGIPQLDQNGKPVFTLVEPHRQYATIDRKPSQFAKHFNAILKDDIFKKLATEGWASFRPKLQEHFKGALSMPPRTDEDDEALAGLAFGPE